MFQKLKCLLGFHDFKIATVFKARQSGTLLVTIQCQACKAIDLIIKSIKN